MQEICTRLPSVSMILQWALAVVRKLNNSNLIRLAICTASISFQQTSMFADEQTTVEIFLDCLQTQKSTYIKLLAASTMAKLLPNNLCFIQPIKQCLYNKQPVAVRLYCLQVLNQIVLENNQSIPNIKLIWKKIHKYVCKSITDQNTDIVCAALTLLNSLLRLQVLQATQGRYIPRLFLHSDQTVQKLCVQFLYYDIFEDIVSQPESVLKQIMAFMLDTVVDVNLQYNAQPEKTDRTVCYYHHISDIMVKAFGTYLEVVRNPQSLLCYLTKYCRSNRFNVDQLSFISHLFFSACTFSQHRFTVQNWLVAFKYGSNKHLLIIYPLVKSVSMIEYATLSDVKQMLKLLVSVLSHQKKLNTSLQCGLLSAKQTELQIRVQVSFPSNFRRFFQTIDLPL